MSDEKVIYETDLYVVVPSDGQEIIREDGHYAVVKGYLVINKEHDTIEATTMLLVNALYQAQGFTDSVKALLAPTEKDKTPLNLVQMSTDDVVPN